MLNDIKEQLLKNPEALVELLETFGFSHISLRPREIRFARDHDGGPNISIKLCNNTYLNVSDFARGIYLDIFSYIIQEKNVTFRDVIQATKKILNLDDYWRPAQRKSLFGGIYQNILKPKRDIQLKTYEEDVLEQYERCGNLRFLNDNISLASQKFWDVRFSFEDNRIIIPIRNEFSEIVGAKGRYNGDADDWNPKYLYTIPVAMSQVLYGYSENYQYLYGNDIILVESEKSVMQAWDFDVRNIVALGSHSLSEKQAMLLLQLQPKRIIIAMDEGLEFEHSKKNADMIKNHGSIFTPEVWYWDWTMDLDIPSKSSITDCGKSKFDDIISEQLVRIY